MENFEQRANEKNPYKDWVTAYSRGLFIGFNEGYEIGAKDQQKKDIEDRFGAIDHIQSVLQSIARDAENMTPGNVAHHRASIKLLAESLLDYISEK